MSTPHPSPPATRARSFPALWLVLAVAAALLVAAVYANGLRGPFVLDDYVNILLVPAMALTDLSARSLMDSIGATGNVYPDRALARVSLALNHYFAGGFDVLQFKITNLVIHLLSAAVVWLLALRLLARHAARMAWQGMDLAGRPWWQWAAFLCAALWAAHPIHVSTVLYVVQRMTSLSALFVLLGTLAYVVGRERIESRRASGWALMWGGVAGGVLLGGLSKENAILLPFLVALVEVVFFDRERLEPRARRALALFFLVTVLIPAIAGLAMLAWKWQFIAGGYQYRPYTLEERLMTQGRALWFYLGLMVFPNVRRFGIYHDDFPVSQGLFDPWTTALALAAWAVVLVVALVGLRRRSLLSFAVLWYLVGHALESGVLNLEMLFEHRNYLPSVGPFLAFAGALVAGLGRALQRPRAVVAVAVLLVVSLSGVTFTRANIWESKYTIAYFGVRNHPDSPRYRRELAAVMSESGRASVEEVFELLQASARLQSEDVSSLYDMARFVDARLLDLGEPPPWDAPAAAHVDALRTPLGNDPQQLRALAQAIDREISRRAREEVLAVNSVEIGRHMERCVGSADAVCKRMVEPAIRWTGLVAGNQRLVLASRALSALARARLLAYTGDVDAALASLAQAEAIIPEGIAFRIHKATLLLTLGRLDEADAALDEAAARVNWSGFGGRLVQHLREQVRAARRGGSGAPEPVAAGRAAGA